MGSSKLYLELERKRGAIWARVLGNMLQRPSRVVGTLLVGNAVAFVLYGVVLTSVLAERFHYRTKGCGRTVGTSGDRNDRDPHFRRIPAQTLFRMDPDRALSLFAIPCASSIPCFGCQ